MFLVSEFFVGLNIGYFEYINKRDKADKPNIRRHV